MASGYFSKYDIEQLLNERRQRVLLVSTFRENSRNVGARFLTFMPKHFGYGWRLMAYASRPFFLRNKPIQATKFGKNGIVRSERVAASDHPRPLTLDSRFPLLACR
jgi:hypothetical protein